MSPVTVRAAPPAAPTAGADSSTQAAQRKAALQRIPFLFRRAGSDITMQALLRVMVDYRTET
ncbi:MAG: hypothetical protein ACTS6J_04180 [Burkholderiales bacterium]